MRAESIEIIVIAGYLVFLFGIGLVFRKLNSGDDDYFRSGCRGSWWMVGMSVFMSGISVATFTSNARLAFEGGWSVCLIYLVNALCFLICWIWLGARFRQMRLITFPQVIRDRFGTSLQQGFAYFGILMFPLGGALQFYSLAIFANGIFGFPVVPTILVVGLVVAFYSTNGGNWAVMAADFLQGMVMLPVTMLITVLCLQKLGGFSGMLEQIRLHGLQSDFQLVKPMGAFAHDMFSVPWLASLLLIQVVVNLGLIGAPRFFACKDGKAASHAALLCAVLSIVGAVFWFIPPITGRLLFEGDVLQTAISCPAEASFAVTARNLLPAGFMGLMMVAMFGASMSTMDTALNKNSAIVVEDIIPALLRRIGRDARLSPSVGLKVGRGFTVLFAVLITACAIWFAQMSGVGAFDVGFKINAMVALPSMVPLFLGMFIKRTPSWTGWASFGAGLVPSIISALYPGLWATHTLALISFGISSGVFLLSMPFWKKAPETYRRSTEEFFKRMATPVDFEKEVGDANDVQQMKILGGLCLLMALFILIILLVPNSWKDRMGIVFVSGFIGTVGGLLRFAAFRQTNRERNKHAPSKPEQEQD